MIVQVRRSEHGTSFWEVTPEQTASDGMEGAEICVAEDLGEAVIEIFTMLSSSGWRHNQPAFEEAMQTGDFPLLMGDALDRMLRSYSPL